MELLTIFALTIAGIAIYFDLMPEAIAVWKAKRSFARFRQYLPAYGMQIDGIDADVAVVERKNKTPFIGKHFGQYAIFVLFRQGGHWFVAKLNPTLIGSTGDVFAVSAQKAQQALHLLAPEREQRYFS